MSSIISSFDLSFLNRLQEQAISFKNFLNENVSSMASSIKYGKNERSFFFRQTPEVEENSLNVLNDSLAKSAVISKEYFNNNREKILSILGKLFGITLSAAMSYFLFKWLMKSLDPTNADKLASKKIADKIMKDIGISNIELNEYELCIASNIILPQNIDCSWQDIGGLENVINDLRETVIYPLKNFEFHNLNAASSRVISQRSRLIQPPKGVLLFGPPGNAKTMIAKALAKESGARFINLQVSTLFDKWFGESQKRTEAIFTLAQKVQPVIIFMDEIDSFLRSRRGDDHECTSTMKTQFMTLWDGLTTKDNRILIIGATNRPEDVDSAILRRMPQMFYIGLPDESQRRKILNVILKEEHLADDLDLDEIAKKTVDFSGSDLHELCRCAAMNSFIESIKNVNENVNSVTESSPSNNNGTKTVFLRKKDFDVGFEKISIKRHINSF